jgi:hypothetical protein
VQMFSAEPFVEKAIAMVVSEKRAIKKQQEEDGGGGNLIKTRPKKTEESL